MGGAWITSGSPQEESSSADVMDLYKSNDVYINGVKVVLYGQPGAPGSSVGAEGGMASDPVVSAPPQQTGYLAKGIAVTSPAITVPPTYLKNATSLVNTYISNPKKFLNTAAAQNGVKQAFMGNVDTGPPPDGVLPTTAAASDIIPFLQQTIEESSKGMWRESGQNGKQSNPNIIGIWKNLGFGKESPWNTDQTAWCMGFVNFALKTSGYRYVQTAGARAIASDPTKWNAQQVTVDQAKPGDIVLWNFGHVNFIYTAANASVGSGGIGPPFTFVGGNQTPTSGTNNPDDGDVSISWKSGWSLQRGGIAGIYRPSKS